MSLTFEEGRSYWRGYVCSDEPIDRADKRSRVAIEVDEFVCTSVRQVKLARVARLVRKTEWTWVKKSTKHFDYGWAKKIESWDVCSIRLADDGTPLEGEHDAKGLRASEDAAFADAVRDLRVLVTAAKSCLTRAEKKLTKKKAGKA